MFERFSEQARRALFFARYEASQCGSLTIELEHLLLALLREPGGVRDILAKVQGAAEDLRLELRRRAGHSTVPTSVEIPFSMPCQRALNAAAEEADAMNHVVIGPEHLLIALLRDESSLGASVLGQHQITLEETRRAVPTLVGSGSDLHLRMPDILTSHRAGRVRIWPSANPEGGMNEGGPSHWLLEGFTLRDALSNASGIPAARIELPQTLDNAARYDFLLTGFMGHHPDGRGSLLLKGIEAHFKITAEREQQPMDVYVMTAPGGLKAREVGHGPGVGGIVFGSATSVIGLGTEQEPGWSVVGPISGPAPIDVFCQILASILNRPVINETGLSGTYELELPEVAGGLQQWFHALEEKLGLRLTADLRDMDVLVVHLKTPGPQDLKTPGPQDPETSV